ncbi:MAG: DUF4157 domain-containing protein [Cyanobacteria bacterium P01_F01_bin.86]
MSREAPVQTQQTPTSHPLSQGNVLQRKCTSCGKHKTGGGTCTKCQSKAQATALPTIQAKLTVGQPNDKYEQEADRVAAQIMRMPASRPIGGIGSQPPRIQRMCTNCEEEQKIRTKVASDTLPKVTSEIASRIQSLQGSGQPLPASARNFFEPRLGHDFSNVRVHTDAASAHSLNARAYTTGRNIVFGAGQYAPATATGKHLLAHELTHVIQQGYGKTLTEASPVDIQRQAVPVQLSQVPIQQEKQPLVQQSLSTLTVQRLPFTNPVDPIHQPLIEDYRQRHGFPPGGVDEFGNRVGPSDGEIKFILLPLEFRCPLYFQLESQRDILLYSLCAESSTRSARPACVFAEPHWQIINAAMTLANQRVQVAYDRVTSTPEVHPLIAERARQLFEFDPPSVERIVEVITQVRRIMRGGSFRFAGRTCGDEACQRGATVAYVTGPGQMPIYLCPSAFIVDDLYRTIIHEAVHLVGIDADPATPENYCDSDLTCSSPCVAGQDVADAWAHFISCLGEPIQLRRSFLPELERSVEEL